MISSDWAQARTSARTWECTSHKAIHGNYTGCQRADRYVHAVLILWRKPIASLGNLSFDAATQTIHRG